MLRKYFKFDVNKLDDVVKFLNFGKKHIIQDLNYYGKVVMKGDKNPRSNEKYNKARHLLLEKLYIKLLPDVVAIPMLVCLKKWNCVPSV